MVWHVMQHRQCYVHALIVGSLLTENTLSLQIVNNVVVSVEYYQQKKPTCTSVHVGFVLCLERESNPHASYETRDFKSRASAYSAIQACGV